MTEEFNAAVLTVDQLKFTWKGPRMFYAYAIAVAADNTGHVYISEFPEAKKIKHRPILGDSDAWDFAFDGFSVYQKTGKLPSTMCFHFLLVRDNGSKRKAGAFLKDLQNDPDFAATLAAVQAAVPAAAPVGLIASALGPVLGLVGKVLERQNDRVVDSVPGTIAFTPQLLKSGGRADLVRCEGFDLNFVLQLFNTDEDADTAAFLTHASLAWQENGSLIAVPPAQ